MEKDQKDYFWLAGIIQSCNNDFHFEAVDKLLELYAARYNNQEANILLQTMRQSHWNHIHSILV